MELDQEIYAGNRLHLAARHKKVGILGGTFNPPHNGHIDMALHIKNEFSLDETYLMPCGNPPHKDTDLAPAPMRLAMARMCTEAAAGLGLLDIEMKRTGYTYTVETMRLLEKKYPQTDFYFIIGADTVFELCTWYEFRELFRLTRFVCVRRCNHDMLELTAEISRLKREYGAHVLLSEYTGLYVSSSYIRKQIAQGKNIAGLVPQSVEEYIVANGLYR
ncbi:MAG: nicotinate-nucleotide adenylyltransferase [Christensenella sp.]|nr:nicotinate-nucleotide adenylyltransferase [Christensenella sp.]